MRSPRRPRSRSRTALARDRGAGRATVEVLPAGAREIAGGLAPVVGDEREGDETDVEQLRKLVEQCASDALDVGATRQLVGDTALALELPLTGRAAGASSATAKDREQEQRGCRGAAGRGTVGSLSGISLGHRDCTESRFSEPAIGPETEPRHGKARRSGGRCGGLSRLLPASVEDARGSRRSAREVRSRLRAGDGPSDPSLQGGKIGWCDSSHVRLTARGYRGRHGQAPSPRSPRATAGVERAVETASAHSRTTGGRSSSASRSSTTRTSSRT